QGQNQPRRDDFGLKIGKLSHRTSIKDGLGRHIGSCGPLNRNFLSSFNDVVRELEDVYGHQELWLYSGLNEDSPIETARRRQKWRSPKILKRNGRMVAEQSGQPDFWVLTGDYHLPQSEHSAPPWKACLINKVFKVYCSLLGKNT
ncbi:hypothetical protein, partial [Klebsiella pneumoniae]|uniref:hypothetical protein n=2 Tax=Klebsiella pneumoniae TaxID=573 RepID=UPI000FEBFF23